MTTHALILEETPVTLWGLTAGERLRRQLKEAGGIDVVTSPGDVPVGSRVLLLNGHFLFEIRTLSGLLKRENSVLRHPSDGIAAAIVDAGKLDVAMSLFAGQPGTGEELLESITPNDLAAFNPKLRSVQTPLLEPVSEETKTELENRLYGNAYRGITDLITKFLWPRPAKRAVHLAARLGLSPNMVTTIGLVLVIAACYLFLHGQYLAGLAAGWVMTFLDTVDGKLARVTIQSSKFGDKYDHGIDLLHPPFWYIFWGMSLSDFQPVLGFDQIDMYYMIVIGYILGRVVEGVFHLLGECGVYTWKPFDAWFRLVTARRNPNLIMMTLSVFIGRPDWGFIAVTFWTVFCTLLLIFRLLQGVVARIKGGPLQSWLSADNVANGPHAMSYSVFGRTRGAYGK